MMLDDDRRSWNLPVKVLCITSICKCDFLWLVSRTKGNVSETDMHIYYVLCCAQGDLRNAAHDAGFPQLYRPY